MKKYFVYIASAVLMMAACAKEDINTPVETPVVGETEFISIELNPATRTILDGTKTNWSAGDDVGVYFRNESIGTLTLVEGSTNKFEGEIESALLLGQDKVTLKYPADVTAVPTTQVAVAGSFANGAALLEGSVKLKDLRAGKSTVLQNMTALLQFTVAEAGDVTFEVGSTKYTVTGCKTGNTYYACVAPASNVSFVTRIGGYLSKKASSNKTFTVGKIADLGVLPAPEASGWVLKGVDNWTKDITMYNEGNWAVAYNVKSTTQHFKFYKKINSTETWVGGKKDASTAIATDKAYCEGGNDIKVPAANTNYDFYYCADGGMYMIVPAGSSIEAITVDTDMYLRGSCNNWGGTLPTMHDGKFYGWKGVKFTGTPEFKFSTSNNSWNWQYSAEKTLTINTWATLKAGGDSWSNTKYSSAGTYDIYVTSDKLSRNKVVIVTAGSPIPAL